MYGGMTDLLVHPAASPLRGIVPAASDKSIVHRAILFASLAKGMSRIQKARIGDDHRSTIGILRAMGVSIVANDAEGWITIEGRGLEGLVAPTGPLDCGNSGTTLRLVAGILAAQRFQSTLVRRRLADQASDGPHRDAAPIERCAHRGCDQPERRWAKSRHRS